MAIELRNSDRLPTPQGYSHLSIGTGERIVHLAGQIGTDAEGAIVEGLAAQVKQALLNVADALAAADAGPDDLAKLTVYIVGWTESMQGALVEGMIGAAETNPFPLVPITLIGVQALYLDAALVEIEGVAVLSA